MNIELSELKAIFLLEINHLEELGYEKIEIPVDYYWNIPQDVRYDPNNEPDNLDLGQLSDDWQDLQKKSVEIMIPLHMTWFGYPQFFEQLENKL